MCAQPVIQASFHAGEWAPALNARVDLAKYHSAAALALNWFVDYRGGLSTRSGTKYVIDCAFSGTPVRIWGMQVTSTVGYVLEFGNQYLRFMYNGAPVLEAPKTITNATQAPACVVTSAGHGMTAGDVVFITGIVGMTQLNGRYFLIVGATANEITLGNLIGTNLDSSSYSAYVSGGTIARVYKIGTPYLGADLALLKFAQNINTLIICHPNYAPRVLTYNGATDWTLTTITFGASVGTPSGLSGSSTLAAGNVFYAYQVTAVSVAGEESGPSSSASLGGLEDLRSVLGSNTISWGTVAGASFYNVYKATVRYGTFVPAGVQFGFVGFTASTSFIDSNISPDFSATPPLTTQAAIGGSVSSIAISAGGDYSVIPTISLTAPPVGGSQAVAIATMAANAITIVSGGDGYVVNDILNLPNGIALQVTASASGVVTGVQYLSAGSASGSLPANPLAPVSSSGSGFGATFSFTWRVSSASVVSPGSGYTIAPSVLFTPAGASAVATITASGGGTGPQFAGNVSVPAFSNQRLFLGAPLAAPQTFYMSQPGFFFNFNSSNPSQADDAIFGSIVDSQLNTIKSALSVPSGLLLLCDKRAYLLNGGSVGAPVTPQAITANGQAFAGANDVPPIVANQDVLYVQAKGAVIRNITYNFYTNAYAGADISILSSHLFYGYQILEWAYAEEPFRIVWSIRSDGRLLSLTYVKEQEVVGWAQHDTVGLFKSVATVTEPTSFGYVDATYFVVQRVIGGNRILYIERMAERIFPNGRQDAWGVDCALSYNGSPTTSFTGAEHLGGATVTGVADGNVITPFVMPLSGFFTLPAAASKVTIGLAFTPQMQTLALDLGEPTVQGKRKKITGVTLRCQDTLGLSIGRSFSTLVQMKDLVIGNVGSMTNQVVTDLVTGDARTNVDPLWDVPGQYCIQQSNPYPASVLGVIPEVVVGDTK